MPDYKQLYGKMYCAAEQAIVLLRQAQEECETMIMEEFNPVIDEGRYPLLLEKEEKTNPEPPAL